MNRIKTNLYDYVSLRPFRYLEPSIHSAAIAKFFFLLPYIVLLAITESWSSLVIVASAMAASVLTESMDVFYSRKTPFKWIACLNRSMVIGLLLPADFPPVAVFFVTLSSILLVRYILGGLADSWVNSCALTVVSCWIIGAHAFPGYMLSMEILQSKNPSLALIQNGTFPVLSFDSGVTEFLNEKIFSMFSVSIPEGYVSLLIDSQSIIPAFRFNLLTLLISIFLIAFNFLKALIPGVFILVYMLLVRFVSPLFCSELLENGDMVLALFTSGTLFCSVFLLQEVGTLPVSNTGKTVFAVVTGIIGFFLIGLGTSSVGFVFTVLMANVISPVIQYFEKRVVDKRIETEIAAKIALVKEGKDA